MSNRCFLVLFFAVVCCASFANMPAPPDYSSHKCVINGPENEGEFYVGVFVRVGDKDTVIPHTLSAVEYCKATFAEEDTFAKVVVDSSVTKEDVIEAFKQVDLKSLERSVSQKCDVWGRVANCEIEGVFLFQTFAIYYPHSGRCYLTRTPLQYVVECFIPEDPTKDIITESLTESLNDKFRYVRFTEFVLAMILTVLIESLIFGLFYRNKRDVRYVAFTNAYTNILMNCLISGIWHAGPTWQSGYAALGYLFLLIILEPIVWIYESIVYTSKLTKDCERYKLKAWGVALLANLASLLAFFPLGDSLRTFARFLWGV